MIKIAVNSLLLASAIGLTACSNSDDSTVESNGFAAFMHSVLDIGDIYADGSRPYGIMYYRQISQLLSLETGSYSVKASRLNLDDPALSPTIFTGGSFPVSESNFGLHVFTGSAQAGNISLTSLSLTNDTFGTNDILIKVANVIPGIGPVNIYFTADTTIPFDAAAAIPIATIAEMGSSSTITLKSAEQRLIVTDPAYNVLFDSGLKTLIDSKNQIIVLIEPTSDTEDVDAVYYRVNAVELWNSNDGLADVRVFNALNADDISSAVAKNLVTPVTEQLITDPAPGLSVGATSDVFPDLPSGTYEVDFDHTLGKRLSPFTFGSGLKLTLAVVGNAAADPTEIDVVKIEEDQQEIYEESKVSITHLGYNIDKPKSYDVHFLREGTSVDLDTRFPEVTGLDYKETFSVSKATAKYSVVVKRTGSNVSLPSISLDLSDGKNHQLAIIQDDTTYKICDFTDGLSDNRCDAP